MNLHRIQVLLLRLCCIGHLVEHSRIAVERWLVVVEWLLFASLLADDCIECSVVDKPEVEIATER